MRDKMTAFLWHFSCSFRNSVQYPHYLVEGKRQGFQSGCCAELGHPESPVEGGFHKDHPHKPRTAHALHYSTGYPHKTVPWDERLTCGSHRMLLTDWRQNRRKMRWMARDECPRHGCWPRRGPHRGHQCFRPHRMPVGPDRQSTEWCHRSGRWHGDSLGHCWPRT